jgi:hypothetical protein
VATYVLDVFDFFRSSRAFAIRVPQQSFRVFATFLEKQDSSLTAKKSAAAEANSSGC